MKRSQETRRLVLALLLGGVLLVTGPAVLAQEGEDEGDEWEPTLFSHQHWDNVLKRHVKNGKVDYRGIAADSDFEKYMHNLGHADPNRYWDKKDQIAFWINAFNACAVKLMIDSGYPGSIQSVKGFETELRCKIERVEVSLKDIRDGVLRRDRYIKKEPRTLLMIANATTSGPKLQSVAFNDANLAKLLQDESKAFLADGSKNKFDPKRKVVKLSILFKHYEEDFARKYGSFKSFLKKYAPKKYRKMLEGNYKIEYLDFDWSSNAK